jgi:hypothetical protein
MTALPPRKITDEQDNPVIAALIAFVTNNLSQSLDAISAWDVIQQLPESGYAEFSVRFGDGTEGYTGSIRQGLDGWRVHTFRAVITMTGMHPIVSMEAHNQH